MKYKLIGKNDYISPIDTVLKNRGVKEKKGLLKPSIKHTCSYSKLNNIERAIECLIMHIEKESKIFIQVDCDPDGYTSSAILINYLEKVFGDKVDIIWKLHEGKEHGIILENVPSDTNLIIVPDSGTDQLIEHKKFKEKGIDTIVLDHHEYDKESDDAIIVNNQLSPDYENKDLSGAGIVYKFCQALDEALGVNLADDYLDLVAIGNIADTMDTRSLETRYYIQKGLKQIKNPLLKALYKKQSFSTKGVINILSTQYYIVPLINACIRIGSMKEKTQMMKSFLCSNELVYYEKKKKYVDIHSDTVRILTNIKQRQKNLLDKEVGLIEEKIKEKELLENKILIVNVTNLLNKNLTGLVANNLSKKYKRGTILLHKKGDFLKGSIRGYSKGYVKNFKQFLLETGKFNYVSGHPNAAGAEIKPENLIEVNNMINEKLKNIDVDIEIYDVDFVIPAKQLEKNLIKELYKYKDIWGKSVEEPLIAVTDIEIDREEILLLGKHKNTIKFTYKNIDYIKFYSKKEEYDNMIDRGERLVINVIGKAAINEYNGKVIPQIEIEDYEIVKVKERELVF